MDYPIRLASQLRPQLRALRRQAGLTQAQLGQQLGVGQARMAEIEADPSVVSVDQFMRLLAALGVTLVLRDGEPEAVATDAATTASAADGGLAGQPAALPLAAAQPAAYEVTAAPGADEMTVPKAPPTGEPQAAPPAPAPSATPRSVNLPARKGVW
ncbi:helix-turn-helix domain-containing protein [Derxia gummosa]|uniref:Helix-turn-helix domain-containing protein n=1 Tax=Derxia gummosa DSM 723 TaxID=1121388 RepID=A0A8B6X9P5_9BURK|nr:helix-turn-helix transcriptional regulator [Derxia gummosa]